MKKKVRIEKAPKRKVRIEGLPEAQIGKMQPLATNPEKMQPIGPLYNQSSGLTLSGEKLPVPDFTKNQMEKPNMQKSKTNFRFNMPIFSGNPYFERAGMYLNQGLNKIMDYDRLSKGEKIAPDDLYRGYYNGLVGSPIYDYKTTTRYKEVAEGGYLPIAQFGDYVSAPNMQTSYNVQNDPALQNSNGANSFFRQRTFQNEQPDFSEPEIREETNNSYYSAPKSFDQSVNEVIDFQGFEEPEYNKIKKQGTKFTNKTFQGIGAGVNLGQSFGNFIKGAAWEIGQRRQNKGEQKREAEMFTESAYSKGTNRTPYETEGYGFTGRNPLAADGMQIRQIGGMGEPNVEVEGREHIKLPNGFSQEIQGKSHAQGGIPLNLPQGTQIFSEKLKIEVKFLKELAELNPEYAFLAKIKLPEKGSISYADLAKKFETKKYVDLLNSKTADPIQKTTAQMMMSQSLMALEKIFMLQEQNKLSGVHGPQVQQNAMEEMEESRAQEQQEGQEEQAMEEEPMMAHGGYHLPKYQLKGLVTEPSTMPPGYRDLTPEIKGKAKKVVTPTPDYNYIGQEEGKTYYGKETPGKPGKPAQKITKFAKDEDWIKYLKKETPDQRRRRKEREQGIPATPGSQDYIYLEEEKKPIFLGVPPKEPEERDIEIQTKYLQPITENEVSLGLPLYAPTTYGRNPLNYYNILPEFIDPRYLDIQKELNQIARGQRAIQSNIGSRGSADIANLLQAQANAAAAQQQAFGQKYNYDRAQDAAAQQFNAQAKQAADQYNQASWFQQLEDAIRRREGAIDTQQRTDAQAAIENDRRMKAFYGNKGLIEDTYYPYRGMTGEQMLTQFGTPLLAQYGKKEESKPKKKKSSNLPRRDGGKIKIKPKINSNFIK